VTDEQIATILKAVSDQRNEQTQAIGALSATVTGFQAELSARVPPVEAAIKSPSNRSWIRKTLVPFAAVGQGIVAYFAVRF